MTAVLGHSSRASLFHIFCRFGLIYLCPVSLITSDLLQARANDWKERKNEKEDERVEGR